MMGLMVLMFFGFYLLVSVFVTSKAASWAKANNKKPWIWGGLAAFMMYNLVFWDLIPTLIVHKHYCDTQAGFWVYKTPEQWRVENASEIEGMQKRYQEWATEYLSKWKLEHPSSSTEIIEDMLKKHMVSYADSDHVGQPGNSTDTYHLSERFNMVVRSYPVYSWLPVGKHSEEIVDIKNNQIMNRIVGFSAAYFDVNSINNLKMWIDLDDCGIARFSALSLKAHSDFENITENGI